MEINCIRLLIDEGKVKGRLKKYFEDLVNVRVQEEAEVNRLA